MEKWTITSLVAFKTLNVWISTFPHAFANHIGSFHARQCLLKLIQTQLLLLALPPIQTSVLFNGSPWLITEGKAVDAATDCSRASFSASLVFLEEFSYSWLIGISRFDCRNGCFSRLRLWCSRISLAYFRNSSRQKLTLCHNHCHLIQISFQSSSSWP